MVKIMKHLVLVPTSLAVLAVAGAAIAAPGVYAQQLLPSPLQGSILPSGADMGIHQINGLGVSVLQRVAGTTNQLGSVALCLSADRTKIGHAYGKKDGSGYVARCYLDGTVENGALILKPTDTQARNAKWAAMAKGQALPKSIAAVEFVGDRRVPLYACKSGTPLQERVGTLLVDGSCRLAPTLTEPASTVTSSSVLLWSATGNAAPSYGWITVAAGFHQPGGDLLKWPSGRTYCVAGGTPGELEIATAQLHPSLTVGSVAGCKIRVQGGTATPNTGVRVFRNDAQSGANWAYSGGTEMGEAGGTGCVASDNAEGVRLPIVGGGQACITPSGPRGLFRTLRRTGGVPGEGDRA